MEVRGYSYPFNAGFPAKVETVRFFMLDCKSRMVVLVVFTKRTVFGCIDRRRGFGVAWHSLGTRHPSAVFSTPRAWSP